MAFINKAVAAKCIKTVETKIDDNGSTEQVKGAGRPCTVQYGGNIGRVVRLALNQEDKPRTRSTQEEIARELNISRTTVRRILHNDLRLKYFKNR